MMISKRFLMSSISSKKRTKEFNFTTMIPQVDLFSFVFWRKLKTPKNHFEIIWPLVTPKELRDRFWNFMAFSEYLNFTGLWYYKFSMAFSVGGFSVNYAKNWLWMQMCLNQYCAEFLQSVFASFQIWNL